jgi:glutamyl-tRNA synthetase
VVDDVDFGITHIIRGEDHVTNTAVQLDIFAALGGVLPRFAHLPLISGGEGEKLSKRIGSISLRSLKKDGVEPAAICAYLARLGTNKDVAALALDGLVASFSLADFGRSPPRFDGKQLLTLNRKFLHQLEFAEVQPRLPEGATPDFWAAVRGNLDLLSEARRWWEVVYDGIRPVDLHGETAVIAAAIATFPPEPWSAETWKPWTAAIAEAAGVKGRALFHPLRLALTGEDQGPEMALLLPLIGKERALVRLQAVK